MKYCNANAHKITYIPPKGLSADLKQQTLHSWLLTDKDKIENKEACYTDVHTSMLDKFEKKKVFFID